MAGELSGKKVAIRATDGVERVELEQPRGAVTDAGAEVELLSIHGFVRESFESGKPIPARAAGATAS
jgi:putative intracellular protease/amidase